MTSQRRTILAVAGTVAVAVALRWWGAGFGLPFTYHPDEHQYVDAAIAAVGGEWNPGRFNNPTLFKYVLAVVYAIWYTLGRAAGAWPDVAAWQSAFAADPTMAHLLARGVVGVLGAATCAVVWAIGRRWRGEAVAWIAAIFLAVAFGHARDSHYAVNDIPAALLTTLAVAIALRLRAAPTDRARARDLVLGGAVVGLAAATKYTALVAVVPLAIAWLAAGGDRDDVVLSTGDGLTNRRAHVARRIARRLVAPPVFAAAAALVAAFLIAVPYAVLDWPAFRADVVLLAMRGREGFKGLEIDPAPGWIFYLKSLAWGLGWPLLAAAIAGVVLALRRRRADDLVVVALPLLLWGYLGSQLNMFARFMLPAVPLLCVMAADVVVAAGGLVARRARGTRHARRTRLSAGVATALLAAAVVLPSLASTVRHNVLLGRTDTRTLAREWIVANVPAGAAIVLQAGGPELDGLPYDMTEVGTLELPEKPLEEWIAEAAEGRGDEKGGGVWLVTSSFSTERRLLDEGRDAEVRNWYTDLANRWTPALTVMPRVGRRVDPRFVFDDVYGPSASTWSTDRPGPALRVYILSTRTNATE